MRRFLSGLQNMSFETAHSPLPLWFLFEGWEKRPHPEMGGSRKNRWSVLQPQPGARGS
jgi:hypothetical protein